MRFRFWFTVLGFAVACGGTSTREGGDKNGNGGTGGGGGSVGGTGAQGGKGGGNSSHGGSSGSNGVAGTLDPGAGGDAMSSGGSAIDPGGGTAGATAGAAGNAGVSGTAGVANGAGGTSDCDSNCSCGPGGCIIRDPSVTPIDPPGPVFCGGAACGSEESCCLATGECFDPVNDAGACAAPPPDNDLWGRTPCTSNAHCEPGWFCTVESGLCQDEGHCEPISNCGSCDDRGDGACRVCGCDGNTYPNVQTACRAGTFAIYSGAGCGEPVDIGAGGASAGAGGTSGAGGTAGSGGSGPTTVIPCGKDGDCRQAGARCCAITGRCYPGDEPGKCTTPPPGTRFPCTTNADCFDFEICMGDGCSGPGGCVAPRGEDCGVILDPVCGCDGISYTSEDCAFERRTRVASHGECK
ncbi:MAG TPA: hypothetical protein VGQ57_20470 [Polyangiaceae bacterium]|nr:hypothetical protein [Polyangiaceae bacterium]